VVPAGGGSGKSVDVSGNWSRWFTLTHGKVRERFYEIEMEVVFFLRRLLNYSCLLRFKIAFFTDFDPTYQTFFSVE